MDSFFTKKYIKIAVVALVVVSLVLQFIPSQKPAQAGLIDNALNWLQNKLSKVALPNITITNEGALYLGNWELFECLGVEDDKGECIHPFSNLRLKVPFTDTELESQKPLVDCLEMNDNGECLRYGGLSIPDVAYPPQCGLKIPMPSDDEKMTTEQQLARRKACTAVMRIQKEAATEVYLAKKIFNNTDPFTECLFVRNCRSSCAMKLGKFVYKITVADVASSLLPTGVVTLIQKILNIRKMIGEVTKIVGAIKTLARDGIAIFNSVVQVVHNVASFFEAASNVGLKMSDALIFGGGMMLSSYAGDKLKGVEFKTGTDAKGMVGWLSRAPGAAVEGAADIGGWALTAGDGALGGAGLTMALNPERAKQGTEGLKEMLYNFAENNLKFSTAKSEALSLLNQIQQDSEIVRSQFKTEPEIDFLFAQNDKRKRLNKIKDEFLVTFETIDAFLGEMAQTGELKDGQTILTVPLGKDEIPEPPIAFNPSHLEDVPPGILPLKFPQVGEVDEDVAFPLRRQRQRRQTTPRLGPLLGGSPASGEPKYDDVLVSYEDHPTFPTRYLCKFDQPRVTNVQNCDFSSDPNEVRGVLQGIIGGLPAYYPTEQQMYLTTPHLFISDLNTKYGKCDWFSKFEDIYPKANYLRIFLDPNYVLGVVDQALGAYHKENNKDGIPVEVYNMKLLNYTKGPWVDYWATIREILGIEWYSHSKTMDQVVGQLNSFKHLKEIETHSDQWGGQMSDPNFGPDGPRAWVKGKINAFIMARNADEAELRRMGNAIESDLSSLSHTVQTLWWQRAGLLADYNYSKEILTGRVERTPYWQETFWSSEQDVVPMCSQDGDINTIKQFFDTTYDGDIMYSNWDDKIEILVKAAKGLDILRESLAWGISPQDPVMVYRVEKAKRDIDAVIAKAGAEVDDETKTVVNQAIDNTIVDLQGIYDYINSKYAYDNYVNCGACEKKNDSRNLDTVNKSAVGQVESRNCCGKVPEILCGPVDKLCTNKPGTGLDAVDTLDNLQCEVGLGISTDCYLEYKDGSGSCSGEATTICEDWIGDCGDCEQCVDNCRDECNVDCTVDHGDTYYECECYDEDDGWEWEKDYDTEGGPDDPDGCKGANGCQQDCGSASWDCDKETESDKYDCPLPGGGQNYRDQSTCDADCERANCSSDADCEDNYCSDEQSGACWWQDYYKEQKESFQAHLNFYQDGFEKYTEYQRQVQLLECLRGEFDALLRGQSDLIAELKGELDELKKEYLELHDIWEEPMDVADPNYYESEVARAYLDKLIRSKDKAMEIIGSGSKGSPENDESTLGRIQSSLNFLKGITAQFEDIISTSALDGDTKDLLRKNFVSILNQFIDIVEKDIIEPIENNVGFYVPSCSDDNCVDGACPPDLVCAPDEQYCKGDTSGKAEDCVCTPQSGRYTCTAEQKRCGCSAEDKECPEKNGFLNRLKCFERDLGREFEQLVDFLDTLKNMEEVVLNIPLIADILVSIEPEFRMEPPQLQVDILDRTLDKAKACGLKLLPDSVEGMFSDVEENKAGCEKQTSFFQTQGPDVQDFGDFRTAILNNPLDSLEAKFRNISSIIAVRVYPALLRREAGEPPGALDLIDENNVFGKAADVDRNTAYKAALDGINKEFKSFWWDFVWGKEKKQELRNACQSSALVLTNDPTDIEESCISSDNFLLELSNFSEIKSKCEKLAKVDLDELDSLAAVVEELEEYREKAKCIKTETCDDNSEHCLACPEWFCQGFDDPKCCAEIDPIDGTCATRPPGYNNSAIWESTERPPPEDDDRVKPLVCQDAGLSAVCTVDELEAKCAEFEEKVQMDLFDTFGQQAENMEPINQLQDEMACVAYERCSWGFADKLYGYPLTTTQVSGRTQPCITCPKWICANEEGNRLPVTMATNDPYCMDAFNDLLSGGTLENGIVWDAAWPSGLRKWPRMTACLQSDGEQLDNVFADDRTNKNLTTMTKDCIAKQKELDTLLEQSGNVTIEFPWDTENWPCKTKQDCLNLTSACQSLEGGTAMPLPSGWNQWPPADPCEAGDYPYHTALKLTCETNQFRIEALKQAEETFKEIENVKAGLAGMLGADIDGDGVRDVIGDISGMVHLCNGIAFQEAIQEECKSFYELRGAFDEKSCPGNDCDPGAGVVAVNPDLRKTIGQFCNREVIELLPDDFDCGGRRTNFDITFNAASTFDGGETAKNRKIQKAFDARKEAGKICNDSFTDMRTPLNEVMRVFSILLGIRNYTGAKAGMGGTWKVWDKNSGIRKDAEDLWGQATRVYTMIMGKKCPNDEECGTNGECSGGENCSGSILKVLGDIWGEEGALSGGKYGGAGTDISGGFEITPLMCESRPLTSYTSQGVEKTGPKGGPVCPDVSNFFNQINAKFQLIRQYLIQIDLIRRNAPVDLTLGGLKINIMDSGDIDPALNEVVGPLYDYAEGIKEKAQLLWAMTTAINFANENCTCGAKSYCPMIWKIPFCVSGLPSSIEPIKNPYCTLVWTLRFALGGLADVLHNDLENDFK